MPKQNKQIHTQSKPIIFIKQHPEISGSFALAFLVIVAVVLRKIRKWRKEGFTLRERLRKRIKAVFRPIEGAEETLVAFETSYFRKGSWKIDVVVNCIKIKTAAGSVFNEQIARQLIEETLSEYLVSYSGSSKGYHLFTLGKKL